jgi:hypothetical protein
MLDDWGIINTGGGDEVIKGPFKSSDTVIESLPESIFPRLPFRIYRSIIYPRRL